MGAQDHAIVVGISKYPSLGDLDGPENDARDFGAWLLDPRGGNVPKASVHTVLSADFQPPPAAAAYKARPQIAEVNAIIDDFYAAGEGSGSVGDRLYLYFAGHGFARDIESAALLMANAARGAVAGRHLPGRPYANWFREAAFFKEVVLFMDCCRESYTVTTMAGVPYDPRVGAHPGKKYFGFATKWSRAAREIAWGPNHEPRGIFTLALLSGLRGGAQSDANGRILGSDLESFVVNYAKKARAVPPAGEDDDGPEFDYLKTAEVVFNALPGEAACNPPAAPAAGVQPAGPPAAYLVRVRPQNGVGPLILVLTDGAYTQVAPASQSAQEWTWRVANAGLYKLKRSDGVSRIIEVIGDQEVIDVVL
jgi:Caspase domain